MRAKNGSTGLDSIVSLHRNCAGGHISRRPTVAACLIPIDDVR